LHGTSGRLPLGKLPLSILSRVIAKARPVRHAETIQGPGPGEDAAILRLPCCDLALHADPITEASSEIGWLALHVAANDVATAGACPRWASITMLLSPGTSVNDLDPLIAGLSRAARELGVDVVGGHTEVAPGLEKPVVIATVLGITCRGCALRTGDARPGDLLVFAGYAGLEGTGILARDFSERLRSCELPEGILRQAVELGSRISIVKPACEVARNRLASSMHDVTEGGAIGALVELALASRLQAIVDARRIPVHDATLQISRCLGIDPLRLIGSGSFVIASSPENAGRVVELLESLGIPASIVGRLEEGDPGLLLVDGERRVLITDPPTDEISRVWESHG